MAFIFEEEEKDEQGNPKNTSGYLSKAGSGNGQVSGSPTSSGRWTNLQKYLDVNADKSQGMVDNVINPVKDYDTNLDTSTTNFNKSASDVIGGAGAYNSGVESLKGINVGGDEILKESENLDKTLKDMETWTDGQIVNYSGPKSVTHQTFDPKKLSYTPDYIVSNYIEPGKKQYDRGNASYDSAYGNLTGDNYTNAKKGYNLTGDSLDSSSARAQALKSIYNKDGRYSAGENSLDNFLSNEVGASKYKAENESLDKSIKNADHAINVNATEAQKARDSISGEDYKALAGSLQSDIDRKTEASRTLGDRYSRLASMISAAQGRLNPPKQSDVQINGTGNVDTAVGSTPIVGGPIGTGNTGGTSPVEQLINGVPTSTNELKNRVKIKKPKF